eukprot:1968575-Prymnesium_polylepis.1
MNVVQHLMRDAPVTKPEVRWILLIVARSRETVDREALDDCPALVSRSGALGIAEAVQRPIEPRVQMLGTGRGEHCSTSLASEELQDVLQFSPFGTAQLQARNDCQVGAVA